MKRKVRNLIRVLASGLFIAGAMAIGLEMERRRNLTDVQPHGSPLVVGAILVVVGAFLFGASNKLVEHFMDDFDED